MLLPQSVKPHPALPLWICSSCSPPSFDAKNGFEQVQEQAQDKKNDGQGEKTGYHEKKDQHRSRYFWKSGADLLEINADLLHDILHKRLAPLISTVYTKCAALFIIHKIARVYGAFALYFDKKRDDLRKSQEW